MKTLRAGLITTAVLLAIAAPGLSQTQAVPGPWIGAATGAAKGSVLFPAGSYVTFGTVAGTDGYGIRDNGGTIECKALGGSWGTCGSGGTTPTLINGGNSGAAATVDWATGTLHAYTVTGNTTFTFSNPGTGGRYALWLIGDGTARTPTWPATVRWPSGVAPTLTSTAGVADLCTFVFNATTAQYLGGCSQNYADAPVAGPFDAPVVLSTANGFYPSAVSLGALSSGLLSVTTTTGALASVASSGTGNVARVDSPVFTTKLSTPAIDAASHQTTFTSQVTNTPQAHTSASNAVAIDWNNGNVHRVTFGEATTLSFSNPVSGARYMIVFVAAASAGTVTWPSGALYWPAATAPTITTTEGAVSICILYYDGTLSKYIGECALDHRAPA